MVEPFVAALGYTALAHLEQARGNFPAALGALDALAQVAERRHFAAPLAPQVAAAQAQLELARGNVAAAVRWADTSGLAPGDGDVPYPREGEYLALARVRTVQALPLLQDVLHLLDRLQEAAEANARMSSVLEILILRALVLEVQGNRTAALSVLERALVLAEPEGYMRLFVDEGTPMLTLLCPACSARDGRRAAALIDQAAYRDLTLERIVRECGVCDAHGFLVTAKNAASDGSTEARQRLSKHSLVEFSFALALPGRHAETVQLFTRAGDSKEEGQMLMKMTVRSGEYAICVRYKCAGVGLDTEKWRVALDDEQERRTRHRAILAALSDSLLSPQGALTATMLPHLTGLRGAIAVRTRTGRAPLYSALQEDFVERLTAIASGACAVYPFETVDAFHTHMQALIETSYPSMPAACSVSTQAPG